MPIFEYHCQDCGSDCEVLIRASEIPVCPSCASQRLEKLMSAPAGHVAGKSLPVTDGCPPMDAPMCGPGCCRMPQQ